MLQPLRTEKYTFKNVPLTAEEESLAKRLGQPTDPLQGIFHFLGFRRGKNGAKGRVYRFREQDLWQRTITLTADEFEIGIDLGKIKGRTEKV